MNLDDYLPPEPDIDDETLAAIRRRVLRSASSTAGRGAPRRTRTVSARPPRSPKVKRALATSLAVTGLAVLLFVLAAVFTSGKTRPADASPLGQAINSLGSTPAAPTSGSLGVTVLPAGAYVYRLVETADEVIRDRPGAAALKYLEPQSLQYWQLADGSGLEHVHSLPAVFSSTQDRQDAGQIVAPPDLDVALRPSTTIEPPSYRYLSSLPLGAAALDARLVADTHRGLTPQRTFQLVVDLLDAGPPPAVQAALYRLAASVAGVRPAGVQVTDALGRLADAVEIDDDGDTDLLLFDRTSGAYLGTEATDPTGQIDSYRLVRTVSVAATLPQATGTPTASGSPASPGPSPATVGASTPADEVG